MSKKTTGTERFILDFSNPPAFTDEEKKQLERLDTLKEEDIDFSDIPPQMSVSWVRPGVTKSRKNERQVALPLSLDVRRYFFAVNTNFANDTKNGARLINNILREHMHAHPKTA